MKKLNLSKLLGLVLALMLVIGGGMFAFAESDAPADSSDTPVEAVETHTHSYITTVKVIVTASCDVRGFEERACECGETSYTYTEFTHKQTKLEIITEPTCTQDGAAQLVCELCGFVVDENMVIEKLGHTPKELCATEVSELTCLEDSIRTYKCNTCGEELPEYTEVVEAATGHLVTKWSKEFETCETPFYIISYCGKCDEEIERTEYAARPAKGHNLGKEIEFRDASCSEKGGKGSYCSICEQFVLSEETPELPHTLEWVVEIEATCEHEGLQVEKCAVCGFINDESVIPQEEEHSKVIVKVYKPATCTENGLGRAECKWCGLLLPYKEGVIEKNHASVSKVPYEDSMPTCDKPGLGKVVCDICGVDVELDVEIECVPHTKGDVVETPATCTQEGKLVYPCSVCLKEDAFVEILPMIDHVPADETKSYEPTCKDGGKSGHVDTVCVFCDFVISSEETEAALKHTIDESSRVKVDPTCDEPGFYIIKCLVCGDETFEDETFEPIGHTPGEEREEFEAPTCDKAGKSGVKCTVCGEYLDIQDIPQIAHANTETRQIEAPQCNQPGYEAEFCVDCGEQVGDKVEIDVVDCEKESVQILLEPTCTENGIAMFACKWCQTPMGSGEILGGHKDGELTTTIEPTCTQDGEGILYCAVCNEPIDEHRAIDKLGHIESDEFVTTDATCAEQGKREYFCATCGDPLREEVIEMLAHTPADEFLIVDPTCTLPGNIYKCCTVCQQIIVSTVEVTLPATGHVKSEEATLVDPTCAEKGKLVYMCTVCEEPAEEEILEDIEQPEHQPGELGVITEPSCTEAGLEGVRCTVCETILSEEILPATGHSDTFDIVQQIEATCKGPGRDAYYCLYCGELQKTESKAAAEHKYEYIDTLIPATCHDTGLAKKYCVWCKDDGGYIPLDIQHTPGEVEDITAATCTEAGVGKQICTICGILIADDVVIDPLGHDYSVTAEEIPSTCTTKGSITLKCALCEELAEPIEFDMIPHEYSEDMQDIEPTCVRKGMRAKVCTVCGAPNEDGTEIITAEALGHQPGEDVALEDPNCTEEGYLEQICVVCGERFDREKTLDPLGHDPSSEPEVIDPTCTEKGHLDYYCVNGCGELMYVEETLDAEGHGDAKEVVILEATCSKEGKVELRCEKCDEPLDSKVLPLVPHNPIAIEVLRQDDCKAQVDGLQRMICRWCETPMGFEAIKWKHDEIYTTVQPTCTEQGYDLTTCLGCDMSEKTNFVDATGHTEKADEQAPTCTEDGYYKTVCEVCGEELGGEVLAAPGHDYVEVETYATCVNDGFTTKTCLVCGFEEIEQGAPARGHDPETKIVKEANCTEDGLEQEICSVCTEVISETVLDKLGHEFEQTFKYEANCEDDAYVELTCSVCGVVETEVAQGTSFGAKHNFEAGEKVAPTEDTPGYTPYVCKVCAVTEEREPTTLGYVKELTELLESADLLADSVYVLDEDTDIILGELADGFYFASYAPEEGDEISGYVAEQYVGLYPKDEETTE